MLVKFANKHFDATLAQVSNPNSKLCFQEIAKDSDPAQTQHSQAAREEFSAGTFCVGNTNLFLPNLLVGCISLAAARKQSAS